MLLHIRMQWEALDEEQAKRVARINVIKRGKIANTNEKRAIVNISNSSNYIEFHASLDIYDGGEPMMFSSLLKSKSVWS